MSWINLVFAYKSFLTAAKLQQIQGNMGALTKGEPGSPTIVRSAVEDASLAGAKMSLAQESSGSYDVPASATYSFTNTGLVFFTRGSTVVFSYESYIYGSWKTKATGSSNQPAVLSTGSNWRVKNTVASVQTLHWLII